IIGEPPLTYLQHYRFRLASQYLRTSNLSVQQISNKVGYSSETAFSQAFKRVFDLSPKQYRQNYIGSRDQ
ncbi:helix-turn-helix domain-containing protein, partial [Acinetobacter nosocomialis]